MNEIIAVVLSLSGVAGPSTAGQAASPRINACSVMPRELVEKFEPNPQLLKFMKPEEEPVGTIGSACDYGSLGLQVNPFGANRRPNSPGKEWQPVSGVGDAAFFRANRTQYAELLVWTGPHHFTIQYSVPHGSTPEATRPTTITLANAIIPKLR